MANALDCDDLAADLKPVTVLDVSPDPYGLDANGDGIGCENESGTSRIERPSSLQDGAEWITVKCQDTPVNRIQECLETSGGFGSIVVIHATTMADRNGR